MDGVVFVGEVHETVGTGVVDLKGVVIVNLVVIVLVTAMWCDFEDKLRRQALGYFDLEGTLACICSFKNAPDIGLRLDMPEDDFGPVLDLFASLGLKGSFQGEDFADCSALELLFLLGTGYMEGGTWDCLAGVDRACQNCSWAAFEKVTPCTYWLPRNSHTFGSKC